jgi:hypothetical protein
MARQPLETLRFDLRRAVGAQHEIATPGRELERHAEAAVAAAVDRQRLIAHFPSVAVRTMEDAAAVQLAEAGNAGQVVDDAGGEEELAGVHFFAGRERDAEAAGLALRATTSLARSSTVAYCASSSRARRRNSLGGVPSRVRKPCSA